MKLLLEQTPETSYMLNTCQMVDIVQDCAVVVQSLVEFGDKKWRYKIFVVGQSLFQRWKNRLWQVIRMHLKY
jgi:hypothetical protein